MKTRLIFLVILIACISCGTNNKPVSDAQKEKIKGEIKETVNASIKGAEEANYETVAEQWLDSPDFVYTTNGNNFSYKESTDFAKTLFNTLINQKCTIVDEKYVVLDNSTVLYTANTKWLMNFKDGHSILQDPWAMQFLFKKIGSSWKQIYFAESGVEKNVARESSKGLNQAVLLMNWVGNWERSIGKDSFQYISFKRLQGEHGLSLYSKWVMEGKMSAEGTGFWAYNAEINKIDISFMHSSGYVFHDLGEFTSPNMFEYTDINKNTKVVTLTKFEFISSNEIKETDLVDNRTTIYPWKRVK
jgi:hypothetical protein